MNNRMRQICKVQLAMMKNDVMAVLREDGVSRAIFISREQTEEYRERYGDNIEILGV